MAKITLIPSGYKAGKLYSVEPTPQYSSELVTNGGFDSDTGWVKGSFTSIKWR